MIGIALAGAFLSGFLRPQPGISTANPNYGARKDAANEIVRD